jgi:hypothetical protein
MTIGEVNAVLAWLTPNFWIGLKKPCAKRY